MILSYRQQEGGLMASKAIKIFGIILAVLIIMLGTGIYAIYQLTRPPEIKISQNSILELSVGGQLPSFPPSSPFAMVFGQNKLSLLEMGQVFREAARDERILAIYLKIFPLLTGFAEIEELRDFMNEFRKSNKKIYTYLNLDLVNESELYLASASDQIYLNPESALLINGLAAEFTFFQKMMYRLKIQPDVLQFKEFKSAENFTRSSLTSEVRLMFKSILLDMQQRFIETIAQEREINTNDLEKLLDFGIISSTVALNTKLVTHLGYEDQIKHQLNLPVDNENIVFTQYLRHLKNKKLLPSKIKIALLAGTGPILSGVGSDNFSSYMDPDSMVSTLREIRKNKDIKALLFRINSPGGSAVGSDKIWREIYLMEKEGKPVVVSMGGTAASGGYYIAVPARKIVAQPSTITGSIGVIFQKFNVSGLFDHWLGITVDRIKLNANADIFSPTTTLTVKQKNQVKEWMTQIYNTFVRKAAEGRNMSFEDLERQAGGRIFTGNQAKDRRLIDELGGITTALNLIKKELEIPEAENLDMILFPKTKSLLEIILEGDLVPRSLIQSQSFQAFIQEHFSSFLTPAPWLLAPDLIIN